MATIFTCFRCAVPSSLRRVPKGKPSQYQHTRASEESSPSSEKTATKHDLAKSSHDEYLEEKSSSSTPPAPQEPLGNSSPPYRSDSRTWLQHVRDAADEQHQSLLLSRLPDHLLKYIYKLVLDGQTYLLYTKDDEPPRLRRLNRELEARRPNEHALSRQKAFGTSISAPLADASSRDGAVNSESSDDDGYGAVPSLLLTCRKIYGTAIILLYKNSVFSLHQPRVLLSLWNFIPTAAVGRIRTLSLDVSISVFRIMDDGMRQEYMCLWAALRHMSDLRELRIYAGDADRNVGVWRGEQYRLVTQLRERLEVYEVFVGNGRGGWTCVESLEREEIKRRVVGKIERSKSWRSQMYAQGVSTVGSAWQGLGC